MINRPIEPLKMLIIFQGSFFKRLIIPQTLLFLFSCAVYYYQTHILAFHVPLNATVFPLLGIALAIFHGFCNSAAYDRFWEGRKLWGALVWQSRNIMRQVSNLPAIDLSEKQYFARLVIAFAHCLRHQLRFEDNTVTLERIFTQAEQGEFIGQKFVPLLITQKMGKLLADWREQGKIDGWQWQALDTSVGEIAHIQAGCERISNTPVPFAYFVLLHRTVYLYCFLLPFGLGNTIGWATPIMVTFVGYTFMALNEIVDEISEPFGVGENDLPLGMMCDTIENQLALLTGQTFEAQRKPTLPTYVVL